LTFRQFLATRRSRRLTAKAHRVMAKAYGEAWSLNASGVVDLLTRPGTLVAVDVETLERVIRSSVAEAVPSFEPASTDEPIGYSPPQEVWQEPAPVAEELPVEPPRDTSIFAEPVGNGVPPAPVQPARVQQATSTDEKRREFVRNFLYDQRAARGIGTPTRRV
jgi:hypothetical protein